MKSLAVINVVGLSQSLLGDWSPHMQRLAQRGQVRRLQPTLPAVTCAVQSSMLTGKPPREHGIVANGWYDRDTAEVRFWMRSNHLVQAPCVWDAARKRDADFTVMNMFWRYAAYSTCDISVIERPMYKADGRKLPDIYCNLPELRDELQHELGQFPLFRFWGPAASIEASQWIADATVYAHRKHEPTLTLAYLPHLDYALQKLGPEHASIRDEVAAVDAVVGGMVDYFEDVGVRPMVLSEYGIEPVDDAVHINRALREADVLRVRTEEGLEHLDAGASDAFAVADHQVAHVYVRRERDVPRIAELCRAVDGVESVLDHQAQHAVGIDHERAGELVLISKSRRWFSYYYWLDDAKAPDFARTVEIHHKPGYDPVELFVDPKICCPKLQLAWKLFKRKALHMRALLDLIPLDASLVRGSHGRTDQPEAMQPIIITPAAATVSSNEISIPCQQVHDVILEHLFPSTSQIASS